MISYLVSHYARLYGKRHMNRLLPIEDNIDYPGLSVNDTKLLYAHVPFCESLCPYCNFHRYKYEKDVASHYFLAMSHELKMYHDQGFGFTEIYIGGGTPTVDPRLLSDFIDTATKLFPITRISIETNPNFLSISNIGLLKSLGVNRLSVGVQSLQDSLLKKMGRFDPYGSSDTIIQNLEQAISEFNTVNVDMIFNLPDQNKQQLQEDLLKLNTLKPTQISWYPLMPAIATSLSMNASMGTFSFHHESEFYQLIDKNMAENYRASSAWCFNLKAHENNIDEYVVEHDNYLGIGSGSFSYINGQLLSSCFSIQDYIERINNQKTGIVSMQVMSLTEIKRYQLLMRLFGLRVPHSYWQERYQQHPKQLFKVELALLTMLGIVKIDDVEIRLTRYGRYIWVVLMREFFMNVNNYRAQMRQQVSNKIELKMVI